ncbi:hypothetical protein I4641_21155 [Waterburya agarophytonicola K14]|uniref:DUF1190 domain-containing protein n=1 Tax=Waterburya agarophytonicola KI4 TaxID=2874699 RepID=A0A964FHZ8_9CYAN|nr:hypothetical protein [Waterburya agarophytonicola]MCC0179472.1 hypothetical protein [Waterburya agarophytonicola KI4]
MLRKIVILFMSLSLCWTTIGCSGSSTSMESQPSFNNNASVRNVPSSIADGKYPVQQATYDDASGEYSLMLLNTPAGSPPVLQTAQIQMARIDEEAAANGEKTYLQVDDSQPVMYLTEDFKIEYVHNVTETQNNPQTGQPQTVVVRRESNFWTPFAGALAGQAIGSMLFRPQYYVPPIYQPGGVLTGYGGYGSSYSQAVNRYQDRYNAPPAAVKNRSTLRTTGSVRNASNGKLRKSIKNNSRGTGSGVGSSTLRSSGKSKQFKSRGGGFGSSSGMRRPSRSFGGGRRR